MLKILESQNAFGTMNTGTVNYSNLTDDDKVRLSKKYNIDVSGLQDYIAKMPKDMWTAEKKNIFKLHRRNFAKTMGINWKHMFMADQDIGKTGCRGSVFEITRDYVKANPNGWSDIPEDLLVVRKGVPDVVIGHPVADCPVVMMVDQKQKIAIVGHCGAPLIGEMLPTLMVEALESKYDSKVDDIFTYVSAHAGETWVYDSIPSWATDFDFWERFIPYNKDEGLYHIHLKDALCDQFSKAGLDSDNIIFNLDNTITDKRYYSNAMKAIDPSKLGRHFAGLCFDKFNGDNTVLLKPEVLTKRR